MVQVNVVKEVMQKERVHFANAVVQLRCLVNMDMGMKDGSQKAQ